VSCPLVRVINDVEILLKGAVHFLKDFVGICAPDKTLRCRILATEKLVDRGGQAAMLAKLPSQMTSRVISAKKRSTMFIQVEEVGVKCTLNLGCRFNPSSRIGASKMRTPSESPLKKSKGLHYKTAKFGCRETAIGSVFGCEEGVGAVTRV
jgi:hypothetical protein